ncbi:carboxypeptidase-like regulatory domain-containing protein [Hymenobacter lutimineralis]|uniref:Carboxypeptidase-like regulatory domain-containing protein n=1 Tax=Hymenobacter lutimineralis TaxID=2606448 RepID=A0A5D6V794_9BACT|nr:carboxypeptidase-like regulatory domain-containing protein [Hymenobacter lutimineralis]TYZ11032.1 carboxypeptidase-like regulatory domain-containing protein [Hymenobacter lutimineralis]
METAASPVGEAAVFIVEYSLRRHRIGKYSSLCTMKGYVLGLLLLVNGFSGMAQGMVRGVVRYKKSLLPGATIVVIGTDTGTTTDSEGTFAIELAQDSATLQISMIGFVTQKVKAAVGDTLQVQFRESCRWDDHINFDVLQIGLSGGAKYTPLGGKCSYGTFPFFNNQYSDVTLEVAAEYQTNRQRTNQVVEFEAGVGHLIAPCNWPTFGIALNYALVETPQFHFDRRMLTINSTGFYVGYDQLLVSLGLGAASYQLENGLSKSWGIEAGTGFTKSGNVADVALATKLAWWQHYWQWSSSLTLDKRPFSAGITYKQLGRLYSEVGFQLSVSFRNPSIRFGSKPEK